MSLTGIAFGGALARTGAAGGDSDHEDQAGHEPGTRLSLPVHGWIFAGPRGPRQTQSESTTFWTRVARVSSVLASAT